MALSKPVIYTNAQTVVPCNACEDEAPGEYYCIECKHTLCVPCEKLHAKFTKGHNVVLRTQIGDIDTAVLVCTDHGEQASCHCVKCNVPVCIKCVTETHRGHDMSDLKGEFHKGIKMLQRHISYIQQDALPNLKKRKDEISEKRERYESRIQQITKDMDAEMYTYHKQLDRINDERLADLNIAQTFHLALFEECTTSVNKKIEVLEGRLAEYEDAIGKNSLPAVLHITRRKEMLPAIGSEPILPKPPTFVPLRIQEIEDNLGKLHLSSSSTESKSSHRVNPTTLSKFISPLKGHTSICITGSGDVWLAGTKSKELAMVDIRGNILKKIKTKERVRAVAVMKCGDIIISPVADDSSLISRYQVSNRKFKPVFDASPNCSIGLSVTSDEKVLICIGDGKVILANANGINFEQIYHGHGERSAVHALESNDGKIYISDQFKHAVVIVSRDGIIMSTICQTPSGKSLGRIVGFAVDEMRNILCADFDNNCIYMIDENQLLQELVECSYGIQNPRWLAVDNNKDLWITQLDSSVTIVKYLA